MRVCRIDELRLSRSHPIFRESPWVKFTACAVCMALAAVPFVFALKAGARGAGWIFWVVTGVMALIVLSFLKTFLKTLSADNWLLGVTCSGDIAIKFRYFANSHFPRQDRVVLVLERAHVDIEFVRARREDMNSPGSNSGDTERATRISLEIGVAAPIAREAQEQVMTERRRQPPEQGRLVTTRSRTLHYPVTVDSNIIRIEWRSPRTWITPKAEHAVAIIARIARARAEPEQRDALDNTAVTKENAERRILDLAERGQTMAAAQVARDVYGLSLTEAVKFVEELMGKAGSGRKIS
jgi:hypothetical protein